MRESASGVYRKIMSLMMAGKGIVTVFAPGNQISSGIKM